MTSPRLFRALSVAIALALVTLVGCGQNGTADTTRQEATAATWPTPDLDPPGVTKDTVKIGFVVLDFSSLEKQLGIKLSDRGDADAQIKALVDSANGNGGIAGHKVQPVVVKHEALSDSVASERKICDHFTLEEPVFAVVMEGMLQDNVRQCLAQSRILMLDTTLYPVTTDDRAKLEPYYISPALPAYEQAMGSFVSGLSTQGFISDQTKVGVLALKSLSNERLYAKYVLPALRKAGTPPVKVIYVDPASDNSLRPGLEAAAREMQAAGIDRLVTIGASRLLAYFIDFGSKPIGYAPRLAVTGFDNPEYLAKNYGPQLDGSVGMSLTPAKDLDPAAPPRFDNSGVEECLKLYEAGGVTFESRSQSSAAMAFCDAVRLLEVSLAGAPGPSAEAVEYGTQRLGRFVLASAYGTDFSVTPSTGATGYRPMSWDATCSCLKVSGDVIPLGTDASSSG